MLQQFPLSDISNFSSSVEFKELDENRPEFPDFLKPHDSSLDFKLHFNSCVF